MYGVGSTIELFRDPPNSLNSRVWTIPASTGLVEVNGGVCTIQAENTITEHSFIRLKQGWKGSSDGPAIWQAQIRVARSGSAFLLEFGLTEDDWTDSMRFQAVSNSTTQLTPSVDDTGEDVGTGVNITDNEWHIYKIKANAGDEIEFYIDNVLKDTFTSTAEIPWDKTLHPYFRVRDDDGSSDSLININWMKLAF